jgi:hypothetical protein
MLEHATGSISSQEFPAPCTPTSADKLYNPASRIRKYCIFIDRGVPLETGSTAVDLVFIFYRYLLSQHI